MRALLATEDKALCEDGDCGKDSATRHSDDRATSFARRSVAVVNRLKRRLLVHHQRIRNWQLCPDSIDKVDGRYCYTITLYVVCLCGHLRQGGYAMPGVCLFVCLLASFRKNY